MNINNYFVNTYSLHSFLNTTMFKNYWDISDLKEFQQAQEKNLTAAIQELNTYPSQSISSQDLIQKLKSNLQSATYAQQRYDQTDLNEHDLILKNLLEKFKSHINQMIDDAYILPLSAFTYIEERKDPRASNLKHPLDFFQSIINGEGIKILKRNFYENNDGFGFSIDEDKEICFQDDWILKFSDDLNERIKEEQQTSIKLINAYITQEPDSTNYYLKHIYQTIQSLISVIKKSPANKYKFIEKTLKSLKRHFESTYPTFLNSIKTKSIPTTSEPDKFDLWLTAGKKFDRALKHFQQQLIKYRYIADNTSISNLKKVLKGQDFNDRIVWLGGSETLRYLIYTLTKEQVLGTKGKSKWRAVSNSFVNKDHSEFDPILLGKGHKPTNTTKLDEAAQILITLKS